MSLSETNSCYYIYDGEDAPLVVALNSHPKGMISVINAMIFKNKLAAKIFYPFIRFLRDMLLFVRGKKAIDNLKNEQ